MTRRTRLPHPGRPPVRSLRAQLTVANVVLLALGIVAATAVSVLGMRYYLLDQIDTELVRTRDSLGGSKQTLRQIDSLSALMTTESDRMGRLVDELLVLARLDQRPELRKRNVDVCRLARDAAQDLRVQQPDRPVRVDADGAVLVHADEAGLRQILGNLVGNVRTHTPADVPVRLGVTRADGEVRLWVADEGPGLAPEDAARVFDRFFRAGGGAGSGLGLAIVQGVVRAHGGEVTVDTAPGEGLTATVTLPSCTEKAAQAD
ncbi:sensor histidine kinase [Streptomyces althioticus]|uniref:sensor histidine kinase n=1 Tax=Streptomyces althioticus TaxID=83380 RepID=UPI0037970E54